MQDMIFSCSLVEYVNGNSDKNNNFYKKKKRGPSTVSHKTKKCDLEAM